MPRNCDKRSAGRQTMSGTPPPPGRSIDIDEYEHRFAPLIAAFCRRFGARAVDVDAVVREVRQRLFEPDRSDQIRVASQRLRKRLKGYACDALRARTQTATYLHDGPSGQFEPDSPEIERAWSQAWEQELLRRAMEDVREEIGQTRAFRAFELYIVLDQPARVVAERLHMHVGSVYRARKRITRLLHAKARSMRDGEP